jgi:dihydrofolate synthase / folylpolyglutamate synthase
VNESSHIILERFRRGRGKDIDLTLRQDYRDLLKKLGDPHLRLPPVFHVAGTNGKGSVCAFLRAAVEAAGHRAHVYTSPHLVTFHERIRVAGELIGEDELAEILRDCERLAAPGGITYFEAATAAAFVAFARHPADVAILEVGLGGRLDATNVIERPAATVISRLSFDHREYLGTTLAEIAREKAGIMRPGVPCYVGLQKSAEVLAALRDVADGLGAPLLVGGADWEVEKCSNSETLIQVEPPLPYPLPQGEGDPSAPYGGISSSLQKTRVESFRFIGKRGAIALPLPALVGGHQLWNAGLAMAALEALPLAISDEALRQAMRHVEWPARLQRIECGRVAEVLPSGWELWLDGGHNDSAGEILADQITEWRQQDGGRERPLVIILGMLTTKVPREFLSPFASCIDRLVTVPIENEALSFSAEALAELAQEAGVRGVGAAARLNEAFRFDGLNYPGRVLVCGSLYLAGQFLRGNDYVTQVDKNP